MAVHALQTSLACFVLAFALADLPIGSALSSQGVHQHKHDFKSFESEILGLSGYSVSGKVGIATTTDPWIFFSGKVSGLEANLNSASCNTTAHANACGVHVHAGKSCAERGIHFFAGKDDVWKTVKYTSTNSLGEATFSAILKTGVDADIVGRVFVVHNSTGHQVGCGQIEATKAVHGNLMPLSGSGVSCEVIVAKQAPNSVFGAGMCMKLEPNLQDGPNCTATNGCGAHIHSGTGCGANAQGGHYFEGSTDPWGTAKYRKTNTMGHADFTFLVNSVADYGKSRPFIVHNNAGQRVACGMLDNIRHISPTASSAARAKPAFGWLCALGSCMACFFLGVVLTTRL